jgi:hypothetical protein
MARIRIRFPALSPLISPEAQPYPTTVPATDRIENPPASWQAGDLPVPFPNPHSASDPLQSEAFHPRRSPRA